MATITERHPATVTVNQDPKKQLRIKVKCVALTGDDEVEVPHWIEPALDWGWVVVPDVGEEVEIECVVEDDTSEGVASQAFIEEPNFRWRGKRFSALEAEGDGARPVHEDFTAKNYGKRRGFVTPTGHMLLFDDTEGAELVRLSWKKKGADEFAFLSFDSNGSVTLSNKEGSLIYLNAKSHEVMIADKFGNTISTGANGIKTIDKFSNIIETKDGQIQIIGAGDVSVKCGANATIDCDSAKVTAATKVEVACPDIKLGDGADAPVARHTEWETWANAHTHPTAFGPSGPPLAPVPATAAATTTKVK